MEVRAAPSIHMTTLGCSKNQVDSEKAAALLYEAGYRPSVSAEQADVVMVNTCAFIEAARRESVETILELERAKAEGARLVVMGCMAQRYGAELEDALDGAADAVAGLDRYGELVEIVDRAAGWTPVRIGRRRPAMDILDLVRRPAPSFPYAYVKTAEGCDKTCSFCAIPLIRGPQRSRRPADIREEIELLCADGVSEVVLVAQDLAAYGRDAGVRSSGPGRSAIVDLLRFVSEVEGLARLRLLYLYPTEIRPALIEEMASNPVVAPYFDLSLQHASRTLLRSMRRPGSTARHLDLIARIRAAEPEAALRSSFIVGYPGETEGDVEELADFLAAAELDWAGFFPYSPEEGTRAFGMPGRIGAAEAAARVRELSRIQDETTARRNAAQVGRTLRVLVDQVEEGIPVGRSYREAPDIDGLICLDRGVPGEWVEAEITGSYETDLAAEVRRSSCGRPSPPDGSAAVQDAAARA